MPCAVSGKALLGTTHGTCAWQNTEAVFDLVRMLPAEKKEPWDADLTVELPQIDRAGCAFRDSHVKKSQIEWPESVVDR